MKRSTKRIVIGIVFTLGIVSFVVPVFRVLPLTLFLLTQSAPAKLPVPVEGVSEARLVDTWGGPRSGGRRHRGIDIFGNRGRHILSTTKGVVWSVGENKLGGQTVWVVGPRGKWHYYAHLEQYGDVKTGQWIRSGHFIGTVGDSGNAKGTPPHLHYGVYNFLGGAINPYPLLHSNGGHKKAPRRHAASRGEDDPEIELSLLNTGYSVCDATGPVR